MDPLDHHTRLVGDYLLGPKIGSGSFAVVWRSRHRNSGEVFAVKEIDKKQLSPKVSENLVKEISILSTIDHPNIIRLFEVIESKDRIFLVLEYCEGGDLSAYIHRHGRVSEAVARRFMTQLAEGLQVLQEKHLIHRDLKPQNLLLSGSKETTLLKIGDFGFARSLTPQGLADTLCGSPLYMAPEIIQNQKYDAKADLWSVGAILFQLVTGKPPFDGNSQLQLFQNILASTELRFPQGTLKELHPDCVDLCRSLLRQNPVERLTFKEFFSHKFLRERRLTVDVEKSTRLPQLTARFDSLGLEKMPQLHSGPPVVTSSASSNPKSSSSMHGKILSHGKDRDCTSGGKFGHGMIPNTACETLKRPTSAEICSSNHLKVSDSMESIEREYVLVNAHITSMGKFSYYTESSLQDNIATRVSISTQEKNDCVIAVDMQSKEQAACSVDGAKNPQSHGSDPSSILCTSTILREVQGLSILHPSTKLQLLHQYVCALAELDQEKYNAGLFLESFSVELVVLAVWKKALQICSSWRSMTVEGDKPGSNAAANEFTFMQDNASLYPYPSENIDFSSLKSVSEWAEQGFILAFDRAEKLSDYLRHTDGAAEMPDAMEMIFQKALGIGTSGAVDEYMENKGRAAASYSKAMLLLTFIVGEATSLPLNPPFSLTLANKKRIENYIVNLHSHQAHFLTSKSSAKRSQDHFTKSQLFREMTILRKPHGYSKMDREDPEEIIHRRAQFLIYKAMEQVDSRGRRPPTSFARIRMCKLKIKIGRRLKKLRRSMLLGVSAARIAAYKQIITYLKTCKCLFSRHSSTTLPIATIVT